MARNYSMLVPAWVKAVLGPSLPVFLLRSSGFKPLESGVCVDMHIHVLSVNMSAVSHLAILKIYQVALTLCTCEYKGFAFGAGLLKWEAFVLFCSLKVTCFLLNSSQHKLQNLTMDKPPITSCQI